MIFIEKIKNKDFNDGIFYTSKYPLISCGFNHYYHSTKAKFEKIKNNVIDPYEYEYEELLNFYFNNTGRNKKIRFYIKPNKKLNIDNDNPELIVIDYVCENFNKSTSEIDIFPNIYEKIYILEAIKLKCDIICKSYETLKFDGIKLISKLVKSYKNVYICKPLSSKLYNPEKFIIC